MSYTLNVEPRKGYLYITVTGESTYENVVGYLSEVLEKCVFYKCPDALIVENLVGARLDTFSVYDIISKFSQSPSRVTRHVAYVNINPEYDPARMSFIENASVNRGIFIHAFSNIQEAEQWLTSQVNTGSDGSAP